MTHHSGTRAYARLVQALRNTAHQFSHEQMAWLMDFAHKVAYRAGYDAGYQARIDQENASYPAAPVFSAHEIEALRQVQAARAAAAADRTQAYVGGPVAVWDADRPDLPDLGPSAARWTPDAGVSVRTTWDRATRTRRYEWRDDA